MDSETGGRPQDTTAARGTRKAERAITTLTETALRVDAVGPGDENRSGADVGATVPPPVPPAVPVQPPPAAPQANAEAPIAQAEGDIATAPPADGADTVAMDRPGALAAPHPDTEGDPGADADGASLPARAAPAEAGRAGQTPMEMQAVAFEQRSAQAAAQTAAAQAAPPAQPPPGTPVPLDGVAVHMARAAAEGIDRLRIELHPASLGGIDVSLEIGRDGRVEAVVRADRPETLELLQRDARQLARALQEAGFQADAGSFEFRQRSEGEARAQSVRFSGPDGDAESVTTMDETAYRTVRPGGVDLRV